MVFGDRKGVIQPNRTKLKACMYHLDWWRGFLNKCGHCSAFLKKDLGIFVLQSQNNATEIIYNTKLLPIEAIYMTFTYI